MSTSTGETATLKTQTTLSHVAGRILDQLSLSSWLPSGVIVSVAVLNYEILSNDGSLMAAVQDITSSTFPQLLMFVGALTLTTVIAQAFEFEAIRFLEGYWNRQASSVVWRIGMRRQLWRRARMRKAISRTKEAVADSVRAKLSMSDAAFGNYFHDRFLLVRAQNASTSPDIDKKTLEEFARRYAGTEWTTRADPATLARYFAASRQIARWFPASASEMLPTTLGNVMKRYEELAVEAEGGAGDVEGIVHRTYADWPVHLREEYDSFRGRLNVYCTLVLAFAVIGGLEIALVFADGVALPGLYPAAMFFASWVSYRAAVASAFGLGKALADGVAAARPRMTAPVQMKLAV